jgi:predicted transcriptional regulator
MPANAKNSGLTRLEARIMQVIWRIGGGTVAAVQEQLDPPLAYTTVQTVLNILVKKSKLRRELNGRAYLYSARVSQEKALGHVVRDLVDRMFGGSSEGLVMSLLKTRQIDATQLEEITRQFNEEEKEP